MALTDISDQKTTVRRAAFAARKLAKAGDTSALGCRNLVEHIETQPGIHVVSGYMAIQTEIDPVAAMSELHDNGHMICVPVIQGRGKPLLFREWTPGCAMIEGDFGAMIPRSGDFVSPNICVVPLVAFDRLGHRLGYGGGFYDRTLNKLRAENPETHAVGFAFDGQEVASVPVDGYDQPLNAIVTESGTRRIAP